MTKKILYSILGIMALQGTMFNTMVFATDGEENEEVKLEILPKSDAIGTTNNGIITDKNNSVRDSYNEQAKNSTTADQVATGVMTRDTILDYGIYLLRFLSQVGIAIGGLMFVYVGYQYFLSVIGGVTVTTDLITKAITGIVVIIFSYAIMRILTRAFLT